MNRRTLVRGLVSAALLAGIALAVANREALAPERLEAFVSSVGYWAPVAYVVIYIAAAVLFLPGSAITLAGGALFGPLWGVLYVLLGSMAGATAAFLIARYVAGAWVQRRSRGLMSKLQQGVEAEGWMFVAFVRLVPLFPFNLLNYALGLTRIPLRTYVITSALAMLPGIAGYTYLGYAGREALLGGDNLINKGLIALAVLAALILLPMMLRRARGTRQGDHNPNSE